MGIDAHCARFIGGRVKCASHLSSGPRRALMLGYQDVSEIGYESSTDFFLSLGFTEVWSLDSVESSTQNHIVHDLNQPIPAKYYQLFDLVLDGGTIEHVFDIKSAISNVHALLRPGGLIIHLAVMNNFINHGFYQLSPTFFYSTYKKNNYHELNYQVTKNKKYFTVSGKTLDASLVYESTSQDDVESLGLSCRIIFDETDINDQLLLLFSAQKPNSHNSFLTPTQAFYDDTMPVNASRRRILTI